MLPRLFDLLVIDTATEACSVAVFDGGDLADGKMEILGRGHAERLVPMISALPQKGRSKQILVNVGPGSFTGIRVGIAAARALSLAWNAPLKGYICHDLVAAMVADDGAALPLSVVMQGGHGEYFVRGYNSLLQAEGHVISATPDNARGLVQGHFLVGNMAETMAEKFPEFSARFMVPDARRGYLVSEDLHVNPSPVYVRAPDAKMPAPKRPS